MKFFKELIHEIAYDEIFSYYITENHTVLECSEHFGLISSMFTRLLKYHGIRKPKELHTANIKKVKLERYGDENYNNHEQTAKTNLEKYGVDNQWKRQDLMDEVRKSNEEKYGSKNNIYKNLQTRATNAGSIEASYTAQIEKTRKTVLEKYGVDWAAKSEAVRESIRESLKSTFLDKYGCENYWLSPEAKRSNGSKNSHANIAFKQLLENNGIEYETEFLLENRYYDFKIGNILVEINPAATHNSTWSPWNSTAGIDKHYHADKTDLAIKNNYRCIHVWDWDDQQKIISTFLKKKETIGARSCEIHEVPKDVEAAFLTENHLQGYVKSSVALGLFHKNELVMIMTFGKPRYSRKYQWEIIRICSSKSVIGGAEKLFNHFVSNYNPESVLSYCDLSKFEGNVYTKLGFRKISRAISKHWYNVKLQDHITDKLLYKRGFDALLGNIFGTYGTGTDNTQLMLEHGFIEIYDCGQATYVWHKTKPRN